MSTLKRYFLVRSRLMPRQGSLTGGEDRRVGMIGQEEAASLTDIPNIREKGTRLGNWLTREQAKDRADCPRPFAP